ncbi:MAG: hypothetical protein IT578_10525 [Verrucomicrobiae bacterium]|nr:hypothetical protein [Verrucomicrobiae bacterium]
MRPWVLAAGDALSHLVRPSLDGRHACLVYATHRARWTRAERAFTFSSIIHRHQFILRSHDRGGCNRTAAWSHAVEARLKDQRLMAVYQNQKVLPDYPLNRSH